MMKPLSIQDVYTAYGSSESGLDAAEAQQRLREYGPNRLPRIAARSMASRVGAQFVHFFALLLWGAAAISFAIDWADPSSGMGAIGWAIVLVIAINGWFGFYQEYRTQKSLEALRRLLPMRTRVFREGEETTVDAEEVVQGDIVVLAEGDKIPADLYLLRAFDLWVNESTLTGESEAVSADALGSGHPKNVLYSGTYVIKGEARGLVYATGKESRYGTIATLTQEVDAGVGDLQRQIEHISKVIALTSFLIAAALVVLAESQGFELWKTFLFALGLLVALIPEGLLPTVTLSLAFGAQRMAAKNFLVNGLSVIEHLGAVTVIATDKTGTITQNTMEVKSWFEPSLASPSPDLIEASLRCTRADGGAGDPVEEALTLFARRYSGTEAGAGAERIAEYPFDYHLKRMSVLYRGGERIDMFTKGAPEVILSLCDTLLSTGESLSAEVRAELLAHHDAMASQGYRVIAFAKKTPDRLPASRSEGERAMALIGFVGMVDPLRDDIPEAVGMCHRAGIRVVMITGDHPITAAAIGKEAGIIRSLQDVTTGEELERLPDSALRHMLRRNHVFARVSPEQKLSIVTRLKEMGESVAVTGDGVNDAPALKKADVGIAMGSGSDVAKESADAVLLDDHFASIVKGIEEGRTVYENIRRFITYMLASNLPEAVPYVLFFWMGIPLALPVALVLAIDLGTDIVPGLALGAETPHTGLMRKIPRNRREPILTPRVYVRAFGFLGMISAALSMGLFWIYLKDHGWNGEILAWNDPLYLQATTVTFAAIVSAQIGNGFSCRSERDSLWTIGWWSNRYYWGGVGIEIAILLGLVFIAPLSGIFATAAFDPIYWIPIFAVGIIVLVAEEVRKMILRKIG